MLLSKIFSHLPSLNTRLCVYFAFIRFFHKFNHPTIFESDAKKFMR